MKRYTFTVELRGYGDSPDMAWMEAVESFSDDPGTPPENFKEEEEDDDD